MLLHHQPFVHHTGAGCTSLSAARCRLCGAFKCSFLASQQSAFIRASSLMSLLCVRSFSDKMRCSDIRTEPGVKLLLPWWCLGHLISIYPLFALALKVTWVGRKPRGRVRTRWRDYTYHLAWDYIGIPQEEMEERGTFENTRLSDLTPDKLEKVDGWKIDIVMFDFVAQS